MTAYQIRENIRRLREFRNLNQEDVADKLNLSPRAYANIENGRAGLDIERLLQISAILKMSLVRLLSLHLCTEEDIADFLRPESKHHVFLPENNDANHAQPKGELSMDTALLPELMKQIEFLRQAYTEIQHDKSMLRSEIRELKSSRVLQTN